jgi:hypothetical protein
VFWRGIAGSKGQKREGYNKISPVSRQFRVRASYLFRCECNLSKFLAFVNEEQWCN